MVAVSQLLVGAHTSLGAPHVPVASATDLAVAIARARTAAGAFGIVGGRLMTRVRLWEQELLGADLPLPGTAERGVTVPDPDGRADAETTRRALVAACAEASAAHEQASAAHAAPNVLRPLEELLRLAPRLERLLTT